MEWHAENSEKIACLLIAESYKNKDVLLPAPNDTEIIAVDEALSRIDQVRVAWVSGNLHLLPAQERFWYTCCPNCFKSINQYITWESTCNSCYVKAIPVPRCRVEFFLNDPTDTMCVTLFAEEAEKLIGYTAMELKAEPEKHRAFEKEIEAVVKKKPVICLIRSYERTFQSSNVLTHTVVKMYPRAETSPAINTDAESMLLEDVHGKAKTDVHEKASEQFFSPTTKNVLEEISLGSSMMVHATAKRPLFGTKKQEATSESGMQIVTEVDSSDLEVAVGEEPSDAVYQINQFSPQSDGNKTDASMVASPSKKTKNKEKEC